MRDTDRLTETGTFAPERGSRARALDQLAATVSDTQGIWAKDLSKGDWVIVRTRNSQYSLAVLGNGSYAVAGGWFADGDAEVRVAGCTWGGHAILTGMVAAPGMCLEFSNGVRTTRIREVRLIRGGGQNTH